MRTAPHVLAALALVLPVCSGNDSGEQSGRIPDDEGIVSAVTMDWLELDESRRYDIDPEISSFSTYDEAVPMPLVHTKGQYVQIGLGEKGSERAGKVVWLAATGIPVSQDPERVIYIGRVSGVQGRNLTFADGTVLRLDSDTNPPEIGTTVEATIDARSHRVVSFKVRSEGKSALRPSRYPTKPGLRVEPAPR